MAIESDPATIQAAATDVSAAADTATDLLGKLRTEVADLQPNWQGQAGSSFQQVMDRYREQSDNLVGALRSISELLQEQGVSIEALEEEGQAAFNRYAGPLNG